MKNKSIKSALRYPGGKSRVSDKLVELMPEFDEYREPFIGGGSVFMSARQNRNCDKWWINDLYIDLYAYWKVSRDDFPAMLKRINEWREEFRNGRDLYEYLVSGIDSFELIDKAAAFFVLNRITFSGVSLSGGYSQESFEKRFTESSINRAAMVPGILNGVKITNVDYSEVLSAGGDNVFIFLDPPYYTAQKFGLYGPDGTLHKGFDHDRFADEVKSCPHRWMITYDDCEYVREKFKDYDITPIEIMYGMRSIGKNSEMKGKEIIITNYEF